MTRVVAFFQPGWADWEAGSVLALLREHFAAQVVIATPDGGPQTSIGGVRAAADAAFSDIAADDADILLAIGSDAWPGFHDPTYFRLLREALEHGRIVGAICAATVSAARAGLFAGRAHTSNDRAWLLGHAPGYAGADLYVDTPRAVVGGRLVSAPGSAPGTFASTVLRLLAPEHEAAIAENDALMAREWTAAGAVATLAP
jgi:putative intracellular protease/amidase